MTWFTVKGTRGGVPQQLTWRDGWMVCTDPFMLQLIETWTHPPNYARNTDPYDCLMKISAHFDRGTMQITDGDLELIPEPPPGVVY